MVLEDSVADERLRWLADCGVNIHFHTDNSTFSGSEEGWCTLLLRYRAVGGRATASWRSSPSFNAAVATRLGHDSTLQPLSLPPAGTLPKAALCWGPMAAALRAVWKQRRPDLLHINNGGWPGAMSCLAAAWTAPRGVPSLMVVNNLAYPFRGGRHLAAPLEWLIGRRVNTFVTGSRAAGRQLERVLRLPSGSSTQIPNAIREPPVMESQISARARLGLSAETRVAACLARFEPRKGHEVLLDAWERLETISDGRKRVLLLAGAGPGEDEVQRRVTLAKAHGHDVRLLGQVEDPWRTYAACDVVVLASTGQEDMPLTLLEAMYAGRAVVATDIAGCRELVEHKRTGLRVPPADSQALARALDLLLGDDTKRTAMGSSGRQRYLASYTNDNMVSQYAHSWTSTLNDVRHAAR